MLRVKDPKVSLDFYTRVMGMTLLTKLDFADMKFRCGKALGYGWPLVLRQDTVNISESLLGLQ
mgnify:CR=1 FL=1